MNDLIGRKVIGFRFESDEDRVFFSEPMEEYVGSVGEVSRLSKGNTVFVVFPDGNGYYYPIELAKEHLLPEDLVGRRMIGFRFDSDKDGMFFSEHMEKYIGREGKIISLDRPSSVLVLFSDGTIFYYPVKLVVEHLITEEAEDTKDDKGIKFNEGKLPMSVIKKQFPNALKAIVMCSLYGHSKYNANGEDEDWLNYTRVSGGSQTYRDAFERHSLYDVGSLDDESKLPHLFHELWNKMAEVELYIKKNGDNKSCSY